jgi:hypothetical protein
MEKHILAPKTSIEEMYMEKTNLKGKKKLMKKDKQNLQITDHKEGKNIIASSSETHKGIKYQ